MRTQQEIVEKIRSDRALFKFSVEILLPYLDFERARAFLKPEVSGTGWKPISFDRESVLSEMRECMVFAWDKVEGHRGLSTGFCAQKMETWVWLLGDERTIAEFDAAGYENYGAPKFAVVCRAYGFPIPDDDRIRNMIAGRPCGYSDDCGCGR